MSELTIIAIQTIKPEFEAEYKCEVEKVIKGSRQEAGCLSYHFNADINQPYVYVFTETWASKEAIDLHNQTPHFLAFKQFLDGKLDDRKAHIIKRCN